MKEISVSSLFDLNNTIAGELFEGKEKPRSAAFDP